MQRIIVLAPHDVGTNDELFGKLLTENMTLEHDLFHIREW